MGYEAYINARDAGLRNLDRSLNALDEGRQAMVNRRAGNALATGDYQGAAGALYAGGNLRDGAVVQRQGQQQAEDLRERQQATVAAALAGLLRVPEAEREQVLRERIAPAFQSVQLGDYLSQITPDMLSDTSLRAVTAAMGGEVEDPTTYNTRQGVVERDPYTGAYTMGYAVPEAPPAAPAGYRYTAEGNMEAIPGGPADTSVVARRAAAGRAPPRGRSGGGSRGGSRSSGGAPASAPAPARRPWERF